MIDDKDKKILDELIHDGRKPVVDIANELNLPRATVRERLERMIQTGVIKKFAAIPDYSIMGKPETAYILVACDSEARISGQAVAGTAFGTPGVYEVAVISGDWDILVKARGSKEEILHVIDKLRATKGVTKTVTFMAIEPTNERF